MVSLEEMLTNCGSQEGRTGRAIQGNGRVGNPFRDSSHNAQVVPFLLGSISTIRQAKLSLAHAKGSHHTIAHLNKLLPTFIPIVSWLPCGDRGVSCWKERRISRASWSCCQQKRRVAAVAWDVGRGELRFRWEKQLLKQMGTGQYYCYSQGCSALRPESL